MNIFKLIKGEPAPDKNDPKYKERYEREVRAGKEFADKSGLTWLAGIVTKWSVRHKKAFLVIVFGTVIFCFVCNVVSVVRFASRNGKGKSPIELQDSALEHRNDNKTNQ